MSDNFKRYIEFNKNHPNPIDVYIISGIFIFLFFAIIEIILTSLMVFRLIPSSDLSGLGWTFIATIIFLPIFILIFYNCWYIEKRRNILGLNLQGKKIVVKER